MSVETPSQARDRWIREYTGHLSGNPPRLTREVEPRPSWWRRLLGK